jgi:hypothetical protein
MRYRSLLAVDGDPPSVTLSEGLLPDHAPTEVGGTIVFAGPAPWPGNHDLLVDEDGRAFAGIVYPVATAERAAVLRLCATFRGQLVRYCVSPKLAADLLEHNACEFTSLQRDWGDPAVPVEGFPDRLRPIRQMLRECLAGRRDLLDIPLDLRETAAHYFESIAQADYFAEWPGGDVDRVEVVWESKPVAPGLQSYFPSALQVELAQQFAEDIWFYRQKSGEVVGIGVNHLDEIVEEFGLELPTQFKAG